MRKRIAALFKAADRPQDNRSNEPEPSDPLLSSVPFTARGVAYNRNWTSGEARAAAPFEKPADPVNPLKSYFDAHTEGRGIWKWEHYFPIYHRHFSKFVGREVHVLEIGVYSGGSLEMWRAYFGSNCHVYGVDIEAACKTYENDWTAIAVGDQADRGFWKRFKQANPRIDVLIDDGGHEAEQQIVTLEEMLPHLRPGGVYLCEDVHGEQHQFHSFVQGMAAGLNANVPNLNHTATRMACVPTPFQTAIGSIHLYPYVTVIEKNDRPLVELAAPKRGTEWQPFL